MGIQVHLRPELKHAHLKQQKIETSQTVFRLNLLEYCCKSNLLVKTPLMINSLS